MFQERNTKNEFPWNVCLQDVSVLLKHVTLSNKKYKCSYLMNLVFVSLQPKYESQNYKMNSAIRDKLEII